MKKNIILKIICIFILNSLKINMSFASPDHNDIQAQFITSPKYEELKKWIIQKMSEKDVSLCWKRSYVRSQTDHFSDIYNDDIFGATPEYETCKSGYTEFGPVCLMSCPQNPPMKSCGAVCGANYFECFNGIADMVISPVNLLANIATPLVSGNEAAAYSIKMAKMGIIYSKKFVSYVAKKYMESVVNTSSHELANPIYDNMKKSNWWFILQSHINEKTGEELAKQASTTIGIATVSYSIKDEIKEYFPNILNLISSVDSVGVINIINAFNKPLCASLEEDFPSLSEREKEELTKVIEHNKIAADNLLNKDKLILLNSHFDINNIPLLIYSNDALNFVKPDTTPHF